jgi:hypothetical protein
LRQYSGDRLDENRYNFPRRRANPAGIDCSTVTLIKGSARESRTVPLCSNGCCIACPCDHCSPDFRRVVSLPDDVDPNRVDAKYRDGVLQITVQRREVARPRQITVN